MSDSIPSATADPDAVDQKLPANAEDRKAAAALSALHANDVGAEVSPIRAPSRADQEALGKAMSRLEKASGQKPGKKPKNGAQKTDTEKKAVKIVTADVTFLVDQLEIHKNKAEELLRAHDGDVVLAMKAFIASSF